MRNDLDGQQWLGYELHDGLLQWIVGARMQLETAIRNEPESTQLLQLKRALKYVELAIEEGRSLIGFIDTGKHDAVDDLHLLLEGFVKSVSPLAAQQSQSIDLEWDKTEWPAMPPAVVWNVFRIAEQAVRNAIRHAGPATIRLVTEHADGNLLRLIVRDNGIGIQEYEPPPIAGHFGLSSMRHRASIIGGELQIAPAEGGGTVLTLEFSPT